MPESRGMPVSLNHFTHNININGNNKHGWTVFTEFITKNGTSMLEFGKPFINSPASSPKAK